MLFRSEESNHCIRVLRHLKGDIINVMNGKGSRFECRIEIADSRKCELLLLNELKELPSDYSCHIAVAPPKNIERFEWFLEKSTEIGVQSITPVICRFSERKVMKPERLDKIITSAAKQSKSFWRPTLEPLMHIGEFLAHSNQYNNYQKFIAHCHNDEKRLLKNVYQPGNKALILIGPEGDFDVAEIKLAMDAGFEPVSLGNKRLRTETAALAACHTIQLLND